MTRHSQYPPPTHRVRPPQGDGPILLPTVELSRELGADEQLPQSKPNDLSISRKAAVVVMVGVCSALAYSQGFRAGLAAEAADSEPQTVATQSPTIWPVGCSSPTSSTPPAASPQVRLWCD